MCPPAARRRAAPAPVAADDTPTAVPPYAVVVTAPDPTSPVAAPARASRFARLRAATDRVPTRWFAGIGTAAFLAATAAFGGLDTVAADEAPHLEAGTEHVNDRVALTVQRAVLLDTFTEAGAYADREKGERVLALLVDADNRWDRAQKAAGSDGIAATVTVSGLEEPSSVARLDDAVRNPWLQPGVPASLVITWVVPGDRYAEGQDLEVVISDQTLYTGSFVIDGQYWDDARPGAVVSVPVEDRGDGS